MGVLRALDDSNSEVEMIEASIAGKCNKKAERRQLTAHEKTSTCAV